MSGRHRSYATQQQQSTPSSSFPTTLVGIAATVVVVGGVAFFAFNSKSPSADASAATGGGGAAACANPVTLNVAVAPDIADAVTKIANGGNGCTRVNITRTEPAAVAGFLAGTAKGGNVASAPDVWIPDTSLWLDVARATQAGQQQIPDHGTPIATTPEVLAMPKPIAEATAKASGKATFGWADLLANQQSATPLKLAVPDPTASGAGLAAITMLHGIILGQDTPDQAKYKADLLKLTALFRGMANNVQADLGTLLASLPTSQATAPGAGGTAAFPATEQKVWFYNSTSPTVPLAAAYPTEGTMMLDFPYVEAIQLDAAHKQAADALLAALQSPGSVAQFSAAGFRDAKGAAGSTITASSGVNPATPALLQTSDPKHSAASESLGIWSSIEKQPRGLIVFDISGSMGLTVPGQTAPDGSPVTRLEMSAAACEAGLSLYSDNAEVGLWTFTTKKIGGATVHSEVVPLGPLSTPVNGTTRRAALLQSLASMQVKSGSRNGLYDTLLDAYSTVQNGWDPNLANDVVLFTDGKDDGLNSMSSDALIQKLSAAKKAQPDHPVHIYVVALGNGVDLTTLKKVTAVTGGDAFHAATPQDIGAIVLEGFADHVSN